MDEIDPGQFRVLFTPFYEENPYQELFKDALEDHEISVYKQKDPIPFSLLILHAIQNKIDIVHLHWSHPFFLFGSKRWLYRIPGSRLFSVAAAIIFLTQIRILRYLNITVLWTVHNLHNHEKQYLSLDYWVRRQIAGCVDSIQVWDQHTAAAVSNTFDVPRSKLIEIPHGNFIPRYTTYRGSNAKSEIGVAEYDRCFLFFGMIRPYKNVPELIKIFTDTASSTDCLLIAGKPMNEHMRHKVESAASSAENVHTQLEYIPNEEVPKYFAAADVCVFPYKNIFNSGSVILAMTFGVPFIAPHKGSIPSVAPDENIIYNDLAEGIQEASTYPDRMLSEIGDINRRTAKKEHNWSDTTARVIEWYRKNSSDKDHVIGR